MAESGIGKSPGLRLLMAPFEDWEYRKFQEMKKINDMNEKMNLSLESQIQKLLTTSQKSKSSDLEKKIQALESKKKPIIHHSRLFARNITPESVINRLSQLNTPFTIVNDEAMGFFEMLAGRYNNKSGINDSDIYR